MEKKIQYIKEYNKEHYVRLQVYLKPSELEELEHHLKRLGISKSQFVKNAIKSLRNRL